MTDHQIRALSGPLFGGRPALWRYGVILLLTVVIGLSRWWLTPLLGQDAPLLPFVPAILIAAYLGGLGPATAAILASVALVHLVFLHWQGRPGEVLSWIAHVSLFVLIGAVIAAIMHRLQYFERELRLADQRKDEFLAMLAHELRNPLGAVRNVGLIFTKGAQVDPATVRRTGELLNRQVNHLANLIDDLLDVARITRGAIELERATPSVAAIVQHAVEMVAPLIERKQQTLHIKLAEQPLYIHGDETRLCQTVGNVLNNAAKYSPTHSSIEISAEQAGSQVLIRVRDHGIGIAAETLPRIFDLFTQADRSIERSEGGLGVGLAIAKHLVELHGGSLQAHSAGLGKGSEFMIKLPIAPAPSIESVPLRV